MKKTIEFIIIGWLAILIIYLSYRYIYLLRNDNGGLNNPLRGYVINEIGATKEDALPTKLPIVPTAKVTKFVTVIPKKVGDTRPWGIATQVDEHTWTMKVGMDKRMGTPTEILNALNEYRVRRGSQRLTWDNSLANYAQERAGYLNKLKTTDGHKGFADFLENQNGYDKLGFTWLGENISYGYQLEGVHLIEWMYAGDKPHDDNQVNNRWNYVGIGVDGLATALIFGTGKR